MSLVITTTNLSPQTAILVLSMLYFSALSCTWLEHKTFFVNSHFKHIDYADGNIRTIEQRKNLLDPWDTCPRIKEHNLVYDCLNGYIIMYIYLWC
jgi:hypothetical protein